MRKKKGAIVLSAQDEDILISLTNSELYGYEIMRRIDQASEGVKKMGFGSLYPSLARLAGHKLIKSRWGNEETNGARRRYHSLTAKGKKMLEEVQAYRQALAEWGKGEVEEDG